MVQRSEVVQAVREAFSLHPSRAPVLFQRGREKW